MSTSSPSSLGSSLGSEKKLYQSLLHQPVADLERKSGQKRKSDQVFQEKEQEELKSVRKSFNQLTDEIKSSNLTKLETVFDMARHLAAKCEKEVYYRGIEQHFDQLIYFITENAKPENFCNGSLRHHLYSRHLLVAEFLVKAMKYAVVNNEKRQINCSTRFVDESESYPNDPYLTSHSTNKVWIRFLTYARDNVDKLLPLATGSSSVSDAVETVDTSDVDHRRKRMKSLPKVLHEDVFHVLGISSEEEGKEEEDGEIVDDECDEKRDEQTTTSLDSLKKKIEKKITFFQGKDTSGGFDAYNHDYFRFWYGATLCDTVYMSNYRSKKRIAQNHKNPQIKLFASDLGINLDSETEMMSWIFYYGISCLFQKQNLVEWIQHCVKIGGVDKYQRCANVNVDDGRNRHYRPDDIGEYD